MNPKWTVRLKIPNTSGFIVKSCKTTDDFEARRFAEDLYYQLEGRARRGEPIRTLTFQKAFEAWSKAPVIDRQVRSIKYVNGNVRRIELWPLRYLKDYRVDLITDEVLSNYLEWRLTQGPKPPALSTLKNERSALNQIFQHLRRKGHIAAVPFLRIPNRQQNARPDIPEAEWRRLCGYLDEHLNESRDAKRYRERLYLKQYILILGNTGIRVGEARRLRWRDVSATKTLTGEIRMVFTVRGKTGEREVVCNEGVDRCLCELSAYRAEELGKDLDPDEYVFCHQSGAAIGSFKKGFERTLRDAGVLYGSDGKKRVPYSLRHTYATMRISEGVSVFQLAANMGTSVEMIEGFYGKKRVRDPKMATEITKGSNYGLKTETEPVKPFR
jgi:integrase